MIIKKFLLPIIFIAAYANANPLGVVITELHRDPIAGNKNAVPGGQSHSFIELTNFSSDTFFLRDVFLTNGKVVDTIMPINDVIAGHEECVYGADFIPPGGVAVILSQSYTDGIAIAPHSALPFAQGTIMLAVNRRTIGGGLANDDGVAIYKGTRAQIDSLIDIAADADVFISAPLTGKIVLSQRQPKGTSVVPAQLMLGGARQYVLSSPEPLSPGRFDALRGGVYVEHAATVADSMVLCSLAIIFVNENVFDTPWRFFSHTSSGAMEEEIASGIFNNGNVFFLSFDVLAQERGYSFEIETSLGVQTFAVDLSSFWAAAGTLVITEIFPKGGTVAASGEPDWFEVQNVSDADINMIGWTFGNSKDTAVITNADFILPSGAYLVITRDDAAMRARYRSIEYMIRPPRWLTLSSTNDTITIRSPQGVTVDIAAYRSSWFRGWTSQSLERIFNGSAGTEQNAWVLCAQPTPGHPNDATLWRNVNEPTLTIGPVPFSPNGDNVDDRLSIRMNIPPTYRAKIMIFGFDGKLLRTFTGEREEIFWDGLTNNNRPAPVGAFYVVGEFTSGNSRKILRKQGVLWR